MTDDKRFKEKKAGQKPETDDANSQDGSGHKKKRWWNNMTPANKFMVVFTGITAASTIIYAVFAYRQWSALLDSNTINREALQSVQRAFVIFDNITPTMETKTVNSKPEQFVAIVESWSNSGATPATDVIHYFEFEQQQEEPTEEQFIGHTTNFPITYVGSKAPLLSGVEKPLAFFFRPGQQTTAFPNTFFWGWVTYRDRFMNTPIHLTEFCKALETVGVFAPKIPSTIDPNSRIGMTFGDCKGHNCVDEDCEDYKTLISTGRQQRPN